MRFKNMKTKILVPLTMTVITLLIIFLTSNPL